MKTLAQLAQMAAGSGTQDGKVLFHRFKQLDKQRVTLKAKYAAVNRQLSRLRLRHERLKGQFSKLKAQRAKLDVDLQCWLETRPASRI
jgi:phage shock protein A